MARTKTSTTSASKEKVTTVKGEVGRPNQSVAAIREQYKLEEEKQKAMYANASEEKVMRTIRDVTKAATSTSLSAKTKEVIRGYLTGNIYSNSANLVEASRYLYYRSPIYQKMCNLYADMYCLDCRMLEPNFTFAKGLDNNSLKQMDATLDFLDILSVSNNMAGPLLNMWIEDAAFYIVFHDDEGSVYYKINSNEAVIDSIYEVEGHGTCFGFAIDMSRWRNAQRQQLIEWLGSPLDEMYRTYESTNVKYIHVPAEYSLVLKQRYDTPDIVIPPLLPYLSQLANLNDLVDSQALADDISFYKLIYLPLKTLNSAKNADDFEITPDLAIDYFKIAADTAIPDGVSSAVIPGDKLETIDFSDNVSEDVNRVENSQSAILGGAGGVGALLNANKAVNNTALIESALKAESAYVLTGVLNQIEAWTNLQLSLNVSNFCHVSYFPVTIFTKKDFRESLHEANTYGYSYRLAYGTLFGFTERQTMASLKFETELLGLQDIMKYPLQSSYTTSSNGEKGEVGEGRPEKDVTELSPSGDRSRNK